MRFEQIAGCVAAFLIAALVPAVLVGGLAQSIVLMPIAFGIALGHAVLLGLPLFLILRSKGWVNGVSSTAAGFVVGSAPTGLLTWPALPGGPTSASINGVATIVNGVPTVAGWLNYMQLLGHVGSLGALAGFVCWLVLWRSGSLAAAGRAVDQRDQGSGSRPTGARPALWLAAAAVLLAGVVGSIPSITKDRTCHNLFRDGGTSVRSQLNIDLQVDIAAWPKLVTVLEGFAGAHGLSFRNSGLDRSGALQTLALSLCNENAANISVTDGPKALGRGVGISVYELRKNSGWEQLARHLIKEIDAVWAGKVQFRDGDGRVIPMPRELGRADGGGR